MAHLDEDHDDGDGGGGQNRVTRQKSVFCVGCSRRWRFFFSFGTGVGHAIRLDFLFVWIFFVLFLCSRFVGM